MRLIPALVALFLTSTTAAFAQSENWELSPEVREYQFMPMPEMGVHNHDVFSWYDDGPDDCCSNEHCRPFPVENFTENPDGSITFRYYDTTFGQWIVIEFAKEDVKRRPQTAPPDPFFHPCFGVYVNTESGSTNAQGTPQVDIYKYCIFRPDSSS